MALIQMKRGVEADLPTLANGEFGFSTDSKKLWIGDGTTNHEVARVAYVDSELTAFTVDWGQISGTLSNQTDLQAALDAKAASSHTHLEANITDLDKYTQAEVDALLAAKASSTHTHTESDITDLDKYTQAEVDSVLSGKASTSHTHDDRYYTESEVDTLLDAKESAEAHTTVSDMPDSSTVYIGKALIGTLTSAASWRIKKVVITGDSRATTWADGDSNYDNIWDNRLSLSYS